MVTVSYYYTCHEQRNRAWLRSEALLFFMPSKRNKAAWRSLSALSTAQVEIIYRYTYDIKTKQLHETVECLYGELYSGEFNEYREEFRERTKNPQEILLVIEEAGLTKEDLIKYKQYFLYDKLLTDWLDANLSRFSAKRWGRIEYIEVLPLETGK